MTHVFLCVWGFTFMSHQRAGNVRNLCDQFIPYVLTQTLHEHGTCMYEWSLHEVTRSVKSSAFGTGLTKNVGHIQPTNAHDPFHWRMVVEKAHILTWYLYGSDCVKWPESTDMNCSMKNRTEVLYKQAKVTLDSSSMNLLTLMPTWTPRSNV